MNALSFVSHDQTSGSPAFRYKQDPSSTASTEPRRTLLRSPASNATRPQPKRRVSRESPGWYNTDDGMTLDDFAQRLNTRLSRLEQWQGRCAQSVVMALIGPTPVVLFVLNPVSIMIYVAMTSNVFLQIALLVLLALMVKGFFMLRS